MGKKVLFINNVRSLLLISGLLSRMGYEVDLAHNADDGLLQLQNQGYDIVVVLESPNAESWTICERIRALTGIPLIVISLNASTETCVRAINAGADYFLRKSFGPLEFLARINCLLQRRRPGVSSPPSPDYSSSSGSAR
jgi:DNA-binding response OmpR family regulator